MSAASMPEDDKRFRGWHPSGGMAGPSGLAAAPTLLPEQVVHGNAPGASTGIDIRSISRPVQAAKQVPPTRTDIQSFSRYMQAAQQVSRAAGEGGSEAVQHGDRHLRDKIRDATQFD